MRSSSFTAGAAALALALPAVAQPPDAIMPPITTQAEPSDLDASPASAQECSATNCYSVVVDSIRMLEQTIGIEELAGRISVQAPSDKPDWHLLIATYQDGELYGTARSEQTNGNASELFLSLVTTNESQLLPQGRFLRTPTVEQLTDGTYEITLGPSLGATPDDTTPIAGREWIEATSQGEAQAPQSLSALGLEDHPPLVMMVVANPPRGHPMYGPESLRTEQRNPREPGSGSSAPEGIANQPPPPEDSPLYDTEGLQPGTYDTEGLQPGTYDTEQLPHGMYDWAINPLFIEMRERQ